MPNSVSKSGDESPRRNISLSARLLELEAESRKGYDKSYRQGSSNKDGASHVALKRSGRKNAPVIDRERDTRENKLWEERVFSASQSIGKNYDLSQTVKNTASLPHVEAPIAAGVERFDPRSRVPHLLRNTFRKNAQIEFLRLLLKNSNENPESLSLSTANSYELQLYERSPTSQVYHSLATAALLKLRHASTFSECQVFLGSTSEISTPVVDGLVTCMPDIILPNDSLERTYETCLDFVLALSVLEECDYPTVNQGIWGKEPARKKTRTEKEEQERQLRRTAKTLGNRICDRCNTSFFPSYLPSDSLVCCFHPGKLQVQPLSIANGEERVLVNSCCLELRHGPGCQKRYYHVYRLKDYAEVIEEENEMNEKNNIPSSLQPLYSYKALATFKMSISRESLNSDAFLRDHPSWRVMALDCEMCYTTGGLEVTRVSLVDMYGRRVLDELVKPENPIIDDNVEFSGVTVKMIELHAKYTLPELQEKLLNEYLFSDTILVGHSLESDLKALRLIHDRVIDTSILYAHPWGLPYRFSLKTLAHRHLHRLIQAPVHHTGEKTECGEGQRLGHDSYEDARVALELVYVKAKRKFSKK